MRQYNNYCTNEQTKRAKRLGAPIESYEIECFQYKVDGELGTLDEWIKHLNLNDVCFDADYENNKFIKYNNPIAPQIIGWLRDKGLILYVDYYGMYESHVYDKGCIMISSKRYFDSFEEAELAAIDAALDYLEKGETK